ncbi:MAG: ATP-binding protein [Gracilibacteraceae bacterium]|jgi:AAA+ superfamily predicted ATPase|nr:ATP-binding protein [Gracilibacteraceae bacterium]
MNKESLRVDGIAAAFRQTLADGGVLVFTGGTSDLLVDGDAVTQLEYVVSKLSAAKGMPTIVYSLAKGTRAINAPGGPTTDLFPCLDGEAPPAEQLESLFEHMRRNGPSTLIIDFAETIYGDEAADQQTGGLLAEQIVDCALNFRWKQGRHCVILISRLRCLDENLTRMPGIRVWDIKLPLREERRIAGEQMLRSAIHPLALAPDLDVDSLAALSGGMSLDAISRMRYGASAGNPINLDKLLDHKSAIISQRAGGSLFVHTEKREINGDVAGLPQIRRYLEDRKRIGAQTLRLLLVGPPGTGKTLVAVGIARAMGTVPVSFRLVKSKWVGDSERNLSRALDVINSVAPVTVIIDEADQTGLGKRAASSADESSAVESSLRGILMEWLGDIGADNGISLVALSNNPQGIDNAFMDRLEVIPVLEPVSAREKAEIAAIQAGRLGCGFDFEGAVRAFAERGLILSGRQIVKLVDMARIAAKYAGHTDIEYGDMKAALKENLHSYGKREELQAMRAVEYTGFSRYLPWIAAGYYGQETTAPAYLRPFLNSDLRVDLEALRARTKEMEIYVN